MAQLMRGRDWASTPLGPAQSWPTSLKVALRLLLTSRFEMWLGWGPDIHFFYNDAYRPTLGIKHPQALGMPTQALWPEIWDDIKGRLETVYRNGEATWDRALLLLLERNGYPEETYHTFSYSPLTGDTGEVEGVFCAVTEETTRVIAERRLRSLRSLGATLTTADSRLKVLQAVEERLAENPFDLPFTLIYLFRDDGSAVLAASSGIPPGHPLAPVELRLQNDVWDLTRIWRGEESFPLDVSERSDLPAGA
ncbi:MAG: hybrid sensor histidine kinase/response regulator, partial [Caulobacteraceae bacterium]